MGVKRHLWWLGVTEKEENEGSDGAQSAAHKSTGKQGAEVVSSGADGIRFPQCRVPGFQMNQRRGKGELDRERKTVFAGPLA